MLRIYDVMIRTIAAMKPALVAIERRDRDLGRQLRRAGASVALNLAEGSGSHGRTRTERYRNALGSAREVKACLEVAAAFGYVDALDPRVADGLREVQATLVKLAA